MVPITHREWKKLWCVLRSSIILYGFNFYVRLCMVEGVNTFLGVNEWMNAFLGNINVLCSIISIQITNHLTNSSIHAITLVIKISLVIFNLYYKITSLDSWLLCFAVSDRFVKVQIILCFRSHFRVQIYIASLNRFLRKCFTQMME